MSSDALKDSMKQATQSVHKSHLQSIYCINGSKGICKKIFNILLLSLSIIGSQFSFSKGSNSENYNCINYEIESLIQSLYDISIVNIENITKIIDYSSFDIICEGDLIAKTPIGGIFTRSRYPEIHMSWHVRYRIHHSFGICITREPRSELVSVPATFDCFE